MCLLAALLPSTAAPLPFVRLFLEGEAEELGRGGEPFRDTGLEARRLRRPALLAAEERAFAILLLDTENTLTLRSGTWAGTTARDRSVGIRAFLPLGSPLEGTSVGIFAGFDATASTVSIHRDGRALLRVEEDRAFPTLGVAASLPLGLRASAGLDGVGSGAPRWMLEGRFSPWEGTDFWVLRRERGFRQTARIPEGVASNVYSPELHLPLDLQRSEVELGGEWASTLAWVRGAWIAGAGPHFWGEIGGRPLESLALRLGADGTPLRISDSLVARGMGGIADLDLRMDRLRAFTGADLHLAPRDDLHLRYVFGSVRTSSFGDERGTNAAQAFLHVDTDLGLLFQGEGELRTHQLAVGWSRATHSGLRFALGLQYLRVGLEPSEISLESNLLQRALAEERVDTLAAHLLGVTGFLEVPLGPMRLGAALGQLIPLAVEKEGEPAAPAPGPGGGRDGGSGPFDWVGKVVDTLRTTSGGTRLTFHAAVEF